MSSQRKRRYSEEEEGSDTDVSQGNVPAAGPRSSTSKRARVQKNPTAAKDRKSMSGAHSGPRQTISSEDTTMSKENPIQEDGQIWIPCAHAAVFSTDTSLDQYNLREGVSFSKQEVGQLFLDALKEWGFTEAVQSLQKELPQTVNTRVDAVRRFRDMVLAGYYDEAIQMLDSIPLTEQVSLIYIVSE